jgi:RNA 2',3'-cyclic 3'-phosphodiesterase
MRVFFAAFPDPHALAAIDAEARRRAAAAGRRPVPAGNLHLTLLFVGEIASDRVPALQHAAAGLRLPRFSLVLDRAGRFARSDAVWLGPSDPPPEPAQIHDALLERCRDAGFLLRTESFHPHVTIFRDRRRAPPPPSGQGEEWLGALEAPIPLTAQAYALVLSEPAAGGRRYRPLERWPLG